MHDLQRECNASERFKKQLGYGVDLQ